MIARTTDAGATWLDASVNDPRNLYDASSSSSRDVLLVGQRGIILSSTNAGMTWEIPKNPPSGSFTSARIASPEVMSVFVHGYGPIYSTNNGWLSFDSVPYVVNPKPFNPDSFIVIGEVFWWNSDLLIAKGGATVKRPGQTPSSVKYPYLLRSTDAGQTWRVVFERETFVYDVYSVSLHPSGVGVATGRGPGILITTDFGQTWNEDSIKADVGFLEISDITLLSSNTALMDLSVLNFGKIFRVSLEPLAVERSIGKIRNGTKLFPNPTTGSISLQRWYEYDDVVRIIDIFGRTVLTTKINREPGTSTIDCSHLPNGTYTVLIKYEGSDLPVGRFVLMK